MTISTYSTGWCWTCGTNACEHVKHINLRNRRAFDMLLQNMRECWEKDAMKLPGLTGEPWRKYPHY